MTDTMIRTSPSGDGYGAPASPSPSGKGLGWGSAANATSDMRTGPTPSPSPEGEGGTVRMDWTRAEIAALFDLPFDDLMYRAQTVHRAHHAVSEVQLCTLLSIKTGGCPEDCGYCSQSASADTQLKAEKLMDVDAVLADAAHAKAAGSQRFCMGAAWRNPKPRDMPKVVAMVEGVRAMGLETCMTLGMLDADQAKQLADAGLDYYNHNIDTSPEAWCARCTVCARNMRSSKGRSKSAAISARVQSVRTSFPGEGRGPVGKADVTGDCASSRTSPNWAPAFAGELASAILSIILRLPLGAACCGRADGGLPPPPRRDWYRGRRSPGPRHRVASDSPVRGSRHPRSP